MSAAKTPSGKAPTADGRPTAIGELNTEGPDFLAKAGPGPWSRLTNPLRRLNQILAGMYTGIGCSGTPHSHHSYDAAENSDDPPKNP